ncbi:MAG: hypothetical protein AMXMBFR61_25460 [Fimbriimonadales bacterium]
MKAGVPCMTVRAKLQQWRALPRLRNDARTGPRAPGARLREALKKVIAITGPPMLAHDGSMAH